MICFLLSIYILGISWYFQELTDSWFSNQRHQCFSTYFAAIWLDVPRLCSSTKLRFWWDRQSRKTWTWCVRCPVQGFGPCGWSEGVQACGDLVPPPGEAIGEVPLCTDQARERLNCAEVAPADLTERRRRCEMKNWSAPHFNKPGRLQSTVELG